MGHSQYFEGKIIWVTGASSGIGRAVAILLASYGGRVVVSARRATLLNELVHNHLNIELALPFDVTARQAHVEAVELIMQKMGGLDICIFNAGGNDKSRLGVHSHVFEHCMALNFLSLVYGIEAAEPALRQSKAPHLVGVASIAGYRGMPLYQAYSAAKAATLSLFEGLAIDWAPDISVSIVCPGFVDTAITQKNKFPMPFLMTTDQAAKRIARGIAHKYVEIYFPKRLVWPLKLLSMLPATLYCKLMRKLSPKNK